MEHGSPALQADFLSTEPSGNGIAYYYFKSFFLHLKSHLKIHTLKCGEKEFPLSQCLYNLHALFFFKSKNIIFAIVMCKGKEQLKKESVLLKIREKSFLPSPSYLL